MPRQIHVTIAADQQQACWLIAKARPEPTTWQEVAREALNAGLAAAGHALGQPRSKQTQV